MANRPTTFATFHGQPAAVEQLRVPVAAAKRRKQQLGHVLLVGPPGLGKTTLGASVLPTELGVPPEHVKTLVCSSIEKPTDFLPTLTTVHPGGVLFLDEIHALPRQVVEQLYSVMEDGKLTIVTGEEPNKQVIEFELDPFTIVAATTREGLLTGPLRARFKHTVRLELYSDKDMEEVLQWHADQHGLMFGTGAVIELAQVCHGTARHAVNFVDACLDTIHADPKADSDFIGLSVVNATLLRLGYHNGLSKREVQLLRRLAETTTGVAGLQTLSAYMDEETTTIEEVYEPYLLQAGLIERTPQGRRITAKGRAELAKVPHA